MEQKWERANAVYSTVHSSQAQHVPSTSTSFSQRPHLTPQIDDNQEGLRASHEGGSPSHNTIIGHSYGTTAIAIG